MSPEHPADDEPPHGDPLRDPSAAQQPPAGERPPLRPEPDDEERPHGDPLRED